MSELRKATKSSVIYLTDYGTEVELTCHFKYELANVRHKFDPKLGGGVEICNGCGPSGYGQLIPDTILGVCITECGNIHNWGYQFGIDREDKNVVDETFKDNMDRLIRDAFVTQNLKLEGGRLVSFRQWLNKRKYHARLDLADHVFAKSVQVFGDSAFWDKRKIGFELCDVN